MRCAFLVVALSVAACAPPSRPRAAAAVADEPVRKTRNAPAAEPPTVAPETTPSFRPALVWYEQPGDVEHHDAELVVLGDKVVFVRGAPVAVATGEGPMEPTDSLAVGLPHQNWDTMMYGMGGARDTFAVFGPMTTRVRSASAYAYHLTAGRWTKLPGKHFASTVQFARVLSWKDAGAVVVEPAEEGGSTHLTWLGQGPSKPPRRLPIRPEDAAATDDGHLWVLGQRTRAKGVWVAHLDSTGALSWHALPGLETCPAEQGSLHGTVVTAGSHVLVSLADEGGACAPGAALGFRYDGTTWRTMDLPGMLVGGDRRGTAWFEGDDVLVGVPAEGPTTTIPIARSGHTSDARCDAAHMKIRGDDDRWLHRDCSKGREFFHVVYRENTTRPPVVMGSEKSRMEVQ